MPIDAGAGALLSYLAAAVLFQATRARELAEQHARSLTADLERMALVAPTDMTIADCRAATISSAVGAATVAGFAGLLWA